MTGKPDLYETAWEGKTGISELHLYQDSGWVQRVTVELSLAGEFAEAVFQKADLAIAEMTQV